MFKKVYWFWLIVLLQGSDCSENIDDCADTPCLNGATCIDGIGNFYCRCIPGKTGLLCNLDDACISNPCHADATCHTSPVDGSYTCSCAYGYKGFNCTEDIDECLLGSPCEHNGICVNTPGSFACNCSQGFVGPRCETNVNECESNPCENGGTCLDYPGFFQCVCMSGFTGTQCEINECKNNFCINGGICSDIDDPCICLNGFEGYHCEINIDECASSPCANNGVCMDLVNGFKCECPRGYYDARCLSDVDECASNPCQHGGICIDGLNSYICNCMPGYTGENCETNIDDCIINPCRNGGSCIDLINSYKCVCKIPYTGRNCDYKMDPCHPNRCHNGAKCTPSQNYQNFSCSCQDNNGCALHVSTNKKYSILGIFLFFVAFLLIGILIVAKRKRAHGQIWYPDEFLEIARNRHGSDGQEMTNFNLNIDVDDCGPCGMTPLMVAASQGVGIDLVGEVNEDESTVQAISELLAQGAELNATMDKTGETSLHLSARFARADAAKRLLDAGADTNCQDSTGRTPLHTAIAADALGVFQILLHNQATNLNSRMYDGTTPLILAARLAIEGMVEDLITADADINAADNNGKTALHWAAAVNNVDAVNILLMHHANRDAQDGNDETPLFLAAREGLIEACKALLDNFANHEIANYMNRTPRDIAYIRHHNDIVQLLDKHIPRSPQMMPISQPTVIPVSGKQNKSQKKKQQKASASNEINDMNTSIGSNDENTLNALKRKSMANKTSTTTTKKQMVQPILPDIQMTSDEEAFSSHNASSLYSKAYTDRNHLSDYDDYNKNSNFLFVDNGGYTVGRFPFHDLINTQQKMLQPQQQNDELSMAEIASYSSITDE